MEELLKNLNLLIAIVGEGMTLGDAKTWLEVAENAERLRAEGHEDDEIIDQI